MADVEWSLSANEKAIIDAGKRAEKAMESVGKAAAKAGEEGTKGQEKAAKATEAATVATVKATKGQQELAQAVVASTRSLEDVGAKGSRGMASVAESTSAADGEAKGLAGTVLALGAKFVGFSAIAGAAMVAVKREIAGAREATEGFLRAAGEASAFGMGRIDAGGQPLGPGVMAAVGRGLEGRTVLPVEERFALAREFQRANEEATPQGAADAVRAASVVAGSLDAQQRAQLVRNMAILDKQQLGMDAMDMGDLALRFTQENVDLQRYDRQLLANPDPGMRRQLLGLVLGLGKSGREGAAVDAIIGQAMVRSQPKGIDVAASMKAGRAVSLQEFGNESEAMAAILANPERFLEREQAVAVRSAVMATGGDFGGLIDSAVSGNRLMEAQLAGGAEGELTRRRLAAQTMMSEANFRRGQERAVALVEIEEKEMRLRSRPGMAGMTSRSLAPVSDFINEGALAMNVQVGAVGGETNGMDALLRIQEEQLENLRSIRQGVANPPAIAENERVIGRPSIARMVPESRLRVRSE